MGYAIHITISRCGEKERCPIGCDIHIWLEGVDEKNKVDFIAELNGHRNYELFGLLAGVRGGDPVYEPRGVPESMSFYYELEVKSWDADGHSHSWLNLEELKEVEKRYKRTWPSDQIDMWIAMMEGVEKKTKLKTRIVFFFDN